MCLQAAEKRREPGAAADGDDVQRGSGRSEAVRGHDLADAEPAGRGGKQRTEERAAESEEGVGEEPEARDERESTRATGAG